MNHRSEFFDIVSVVLLLLFHLHYDLDAGSHVELFSGSGNISMIKECLVFSCHRLLFLLKSTNSHI